MTDAVAPPPPSMPSGDAVTLTRLETLRRAWWLGIPLLLAVPAAFAGAFTAWLAPPAWVQAGLGAAGWIVALQLRLPVSLVARQLSHSHAGRPRLWSSRRGPRRR